MNRHSFRWTGLAFGALFLSIAGNWAVWQGELLTTREMSYLASAVLIAGGALGVLATFRKPPASTPTTDPTDPTDPTVPESGTYPTVPESGTYPTVPESGTDEEIPS